MHKKSISAVEREEFVYDWMSYIIQRGRWLHTDALNVHALTDDKIVDYKDSFYEDHERV
jgi:hypothetical protein